MTAPRKPLGKAPKAKAVPGLEIKAVAGMVADGWTQNAIAAHYGVTRTALRWWVASDPERDSAVRAARAQAAQAYAEAAMELLDAASDPFALAKAREQAQHLRWSASKANPAAYGDKQQVELDAKVTMSREQIDSKLSVLLGKLGQ